MTMIIDGRKPLAIGRVVNMPPVLIDGLWFVHDGAIDKIEAVYIDGTRIAGPRSDFDSAHGLRNARIPSGFYSTCVNEGCFRLSDDLRFYTFVVADVVNTKAGWYQKPHEGVVP